MEDSTKPKIKKKVSKKWRWTRRSVQAIFLLVFLYLSFITVQGVSGRLPTDLFFHLDPLAGIASMLAGRVWIAPMVLGIITLVLAVVFGRVWCGWICPLGTVLDYVPSRRDCSKPTVSTKWGQVKYFVFFAIIIGAVFGSLTLNIFDPITLFFRTLAGAILPGLDRVVAGFESWLYGFSSLRPLADWIDGVFRGWLLNDRAFYLPNMVILAVFAVVLGLNAVRSRFWCRYLCPLGGLLGLISKISFIRHRVDTAKCISCRRCSTVCPTGAIQPDNNFAASVSECTTCLNCLETCPTGAISFGGEKQAAPLTDGSRRWFLYGVGAAAIAALFFRFVPSLAGKDPVSVRPPGSTEASLSSKCIRCGECVKVCPTGVIQPGQTRDQSGLWTPVLDTRHGYCDYSCNSCGIICPTGAIANLPLEQKEKTVIGIASIDRTRCITWAEGRDCIVCEEMCPIPEKAIRLGGGGRGSNGARHPQVVDDLCIGCGICEHQCPVAGEAAIRVYPRTTVL